MTPLTFGSLFAGIGGIDLGLEAAGLECRWQVEWDSFCTKVLEKHWPDVTRFGDIHDVGRHNLGRVDVIAGGFPCQPVSIAGKRKAQEDDRWLWPQFARVIRDLQPEYVLVENVPGLLTSQKGRAAQEVFGDLAALGFDAVWESIPAAAVGAPHLRYRILILAYKPVAYTKPQGPQGCGAEYQLEETGEDVVTPRPGTSAGAGALVADSKSKISRGGGTIGSEEGRPQTPAGSSCSCPPIALDGNRDGTSWEVEPGMGRVADGIPDQVDRLKSLGNAVVPRQAQWVADRLVEFHKRRYGLQ